MSLSPLTPNIMHLFNNQPVTPGTSRITGQGGDFTGGFADILTESLNNAVHADQVDKSSTLDLLTGEADDLSGLLIDMQKAELSLQLALQIRNKVIDAYNEVMRMSV